MTDGRPLRSPPLDAPDRQGHVSPWTVLVGVAILGYAVLFTAKTSAAYLSGGSLFDLACYVQGFSNALGQPPFFYSLEGEMSRFGRHFSPIFYLLLPFWMARPDPTTLLALQAVAIGLGAVPVYLFASWRLGKPLGALFAIAYLLNPAVADINVKNDFHEISFALPTMLFAMYFGSRGRVAPYFVSLLLAVATREEVALTMALFGLYLAGIGGRRRLGIATFAACVAWFAIVAAVVMPAYNSGARFPMADGYAYLGDSPIGVLQGAAQQPSTVIAELLRPEKLKYVFWLLAPLAFLSLLAPEVLAISTISLAEILVSRNQYHFEIFERYAAPILPAIFLAAIIGAGRLARSPGRVGRVAPVVIALSLILSVGLSEARLRKWPLEFHFTPSPHMATALRVASLVPSQASVVVSDHRVLPHLAQRRLLYPLRPGGPMADFAVLDLKGEAVSNVPPDQLRQAADLFLRNPEYDVLACEDGVILAARSGEWNLPTVGSSSDPPIAEFAAGVRLDSVVAGIAKAGNALSVDLKWTATRRIGRDLQVFVHLTGSDGRPLAQHDGSPQSGLCPASIWTPGLSLVDHHDLHVPADLARGVYDLRVGLYDPSTLERTRVISGTGSADSVVIPVAVAQ